MSLTMGSGPLAGKPAGATNYTIEAPRHRIWFEPYPRRLRAFAGGRLVLDTTRAHLLHETGIPPVPYAPLEDFAADLLTPTEQTTHCPFKGDAAYWTVTAGDTVLEDVLWGYPEPLEGAPWLAGHAALYWDRMDSWFIEDERVFGHLKDPYHRVDVYETDRPVRVLRGDDVLAETTRAKLLFETVRCRGACTCPAATSRRGCSSRARRRRSARTRGPRATGRSTARPTRRGRTRPRCRRR
jgi:uncharacterized protein (DUF427 family)